MKKLFLLVAICLSAFAVGQDIEQQDIRQLQETKNEVTDKYNNTPDQDTAEKDRLLGLISKIDSEMCSVNTNMRGLKASNAKTIGAVKSLQHSDIDQNTQIKGLKDTVYGKIDPKTKKLDGGMVKSLKELNNWKDELIKENGPLWWLEAKKGDLQGAIDILPSSKAFFTAVKAAGYVDDKGEFSASKFVLAFKEYGRRLDDQGKRLDDQEGRVSGFRTALWFIGFIALAALALGVINFLRGRSSATTSNPTPPTPSAATAPAATTSPAPATDPPPIITRISVNSGSMAGGDAFVLYGKGFRSGVDVAFEKVAMGTPYPVAGLSVKGGKIIGQTPKVGATGLYKVTVLNPDGQSASIDFNYTP